MNKAYYYTNVGPKYLPTKGEVWPAPQREIKSVVDYYVYDSSKFDVVVSIDFTSNHSWAKLLTIQFRLVA